MTHPAELSAIDLLGLYRKKALSPVEAVDAVLGRIASLNPVFNAFRLVDADAARAQARQSEARWQRGAPKGLLDGVPVALKDLLHVQGWPTRRGSLATPDAPATEDSPAAARLREHGAVLLGKTNTSEFGWKGLHPIVALSRKVYQKGVTLSKRAMRAVEARLERHPKLPYWDILIRPASRA